MLQFLGRKKVPGESINNVKLPTPVANNHATAAALAIGNNNIELFDDDEDDESLPEEFMLKSDEVDVDDKELKMSRKNADLDGKLNELFGREKKAWIL